MKYSSSGLGEKQKWLSLDLQAAEFPRRLWGIIS
jgi:hypothetical protein